MSTARDKIAGQYVSGEGSLFDVPPAAIGRFRVLHQVGAGTSGPVFRAVHPETSAALAIKLVTLPFAPERVSAVVRNLESLVGLASTSGGACEVIDAGLHGSTPYLVTAFAPGDALDAALRQFGPAALVDLVPRLRILARALDEAAADDILHGALHPRDVLVSDSSTVLTGLGVWPILVRHGQRLPLRRPYRGPELADTTVSAAGDRFAMAALAYEWMTGRRAPSTFVAGDVAPLPGVDREALGRIFARALHADPGERYDTCEALVADLAEVEVDDAVSPPAEAARASGRTRRRGSRAASATSLPLDLSEAVGVDEVAPPPPETSPVPAGTPVEDPTAESGTSRDEEEKAPPAAAATIHAIEPMTGPGPGLLREPVDTPVPSAGTSTPGWARLVAGLLVGSVLGLGAGYALWGRDGAGESATPAASGAAEATAAPAAAPAESGPAATPAAAPVVSAPPPTPEPATAASTADAPVSARPAGNLLVRSTPAGATVFVDGERRGVTPLTLQQMALGMRSVRIQRDGFATEERQIALTADRPSRSLDVRLTRAASSRPAAPAPAGPAARTGTLVIESRPTGAAVVLNGRRIGQTPMTVDDLEPGAYTVQLQLPAHRTVTTTVRVVAGGRARAAASLERAQEP